MPTKAARTATVAARAAWDGVKPGDIYWPAPTGTTMNKPPFELEN